MRKQFTVTIGDYEPEVFERFEDAARYWDRETCGRPAPVGGIGIKVWDNEGTMVRNGYILLVVADGSVYINPLGDKE